jgi:hypothetical protein
VADEKLVELANALISEAANRLLLIPGTRGVFITLVHEDTDMPLGSCTFAEAATPRDIVIALRRSNDSTEVLTKMLLAHMDGSTSEREDSADLGESTDVGDVPDAGDEPADAQVVDTSDATEGAESEPS